MITQTDIHIIETAGGAFIFFLLLHFALFRFFKPEQLFKGIMLTFAAGFLADVMAVACAASSPASEGWLTAALSIFIYSLSAFVYILCFFGPYETSIRMRLVRELAASAQGLPLQELLARYNTASILDTRLKRLLGAGDLRLENDTYRICPKLNAFFAIDAVARKIHAFIHGR